MTVICSQVNGVKAERCAPAAQAGRRRRPTYGCARLHGAHAGSFLNTIAYLPLPVCQRAPHTHPCTTERASMHLTIPMSHLRITPVRYRSYWTRLSVRACLGVSQAQQQRRDALVPRRRVPPPLHLRQQCAHLRPEALVRAPARCRPRLIRHARQADPPAHAHIKSSARSMHKRLRLLHMPHAGIRCWGMQQGSSCQKRRGQHSPCPPNACMTA